MARATPQKIAQRVFRDWCAYHGATVEVAMAADLVGRIAREIEAERVQTKADLIRDTHQHQN